MLLTEIKPVCDRRYCYSAFENILLRTQEHRRDVAPIAPSPDSDSALIQESKIFKEIPVKKTANFSGFEKLSNSKNLAFTMIEGNGLVPHSRNLVLNLNSS